MEPLRPTRRTLTRSAVWTVPVVAVAATAPAYAASPCDCAGFSIEPFPSTGTLGNNWAITRVSGTISGNAQSTFESPNQFNPADDPPALGTLVMQAGRTVCVTSGKRYRFQYDYTMYTANGYPQTAVLKVGTVTIPGTNLSSEQSQTSGSIDVTWTSSLTGSFTLAFVHTTTGVGLGNAFGDEIKIKNVRASCSA